MAKRRPDAKPTKKSKTPNKSSSTKSLTQLEINAAKVKVIKQRARKTIEELERAGYAVPELTKKIAYSETASKVTAETLKRFQGKSSKIAPSRIKSESRHTLEITRVVAMGKVRPLKEPVRVPYSQSESQKPGRLINKLISTKVPAYDFKAKKNVMKSVRTEREDQILFSLLMDLGYKAEDITAGIKTKYFTISSSYTDKEKLANHIAFKDLSDLAGDTRLWKRIQSLAESPYTSMEAYNAYSVEYHDRSYKTFMKKHNFTPDIAEDLSWILNTTQFWSMLENKYSYTDHKNEGQREIAYKNMAKDLAEIADTKPDELETINQMLRAGEDYDKVRQTITDILNSKI